MTSVQRVAITLFFEDMHKSYIITLKDYYPLWKMKKFISQQYNIPQSDLVLTYKDRTCEDHDTLSTVGWIHDDPTEFIIYRD